tara:strand:+ start:83 stop:379 length:297 start_codon:yes stop_codon:yes gene_type:complete
MALQMQLSFPQYGFTAPSAYLRVSNMQVIDSSAGWVAKFSLKVYFSATAKSSGKAPIEEVTHTFTYSATSANEDQYNVVKQAYEYLKTLSQFSGATNV